MMAKGTPEERRRATRVDAALDLKLQLTADEHGDFGPLDTINVSSSGIYFRSQGYIEPMTRLSMNFDVPTGEGEEGEVNCEGIVARVVPELPNPAAEDYEVAVFFTTIDAESLANLERYIATRLQA